MLVAKKDMSLYYEREDVKVVRKTKNNPKKHVVLKLKLVGMAVLMLTVCLSILLRYAYITEVRYEITELDKNIYKLGREKQNAVAELDKVKESGWIEKEVKEKLGMVYPTNEQTIFISVNEDLFNEVSLEKSEEEKSFAFLSSFRNIFSKLSSLL